MVKILSLVLTIIDALDGSVTVFDNYIQNIVMRWVKFEVKKMIFRYPLGTAGGLVRYCTKDDRLIKKHDNVKEKKLC